MAICRQEPAACEGRLTLDPQRNLTRAAEERIDPILPPLRPSAFWSGSFGRRLDPKSATCISLLGHLPFTILCGPPSLRVGTVLSTNPIPPIPPGRAMRPPSPLHGDHFRPRRLALLGIASLPRGEYLHCYRHVVPRKHAFERLSSEQVSASFRPLKTASPDEAHPSRNHSHRRARLCARGG